MKANELNKIWKGPKIPNSPLAAFFLQMMHDTS